jgi:FlaA1/EpsC-like NDP-sugar epimerase
VNSAGLLNSENNYFYTVIDNKKSVTEFRVEALLEIKHIYNTKGLKLRYVNMLSITECKMDPAGKVALVTGGASGIGLAICKELLQNKVKGIHFHV